MLRRLIGKRYGSLEDIKKDIEKYSGKVVFTIDKSQTENIEGLDYMIDYDFEDCDVHTLFYLYDNASNYYITEV